MDIFDTGANKKMKYKKNVFSAASIIIFTLFLGVLLTACSTKNKQAKKSIALEKAKKIEFIDVSFDCSLTIALSDLHHICLKRDPAHEDVKFSLGTDALDLANTKMNLNLTNVTLAETLGRIADSVGLEVQANDTEILLVRKIVKQ